MARGTNVLDGVRGTFATRRATLSVASADRFLRFGVVARSLFADFDPLRLPVGVALHFMSCFRFRSVSKLELSRGRPGPCVPTVELSASWGFPRAGRWPEGPRTEFWRLSQTDTIPYMLAIYTLHFCAPAAPGPLWATRLAWLSLGCLAGLAAWLSGCLAGMAAWLALSVWLLSSWRPPCAGRWAEGSRTEF